MPAGSESWRAIPFERRRTSRFPWSPSRSSIGAGISSNALTRPAIISRNRSRGRSTTLPSRKTFVQPGADTFGLSFGGSMAERPTMTIVPIQGEEFTSRTLTAFDESRLTFMFQQGVEPANSLRLMASGYGESAFNRNMPYVVDEYRGFVAVSRISPP